MELDACGKHSLLKGGLEFGALLMLCVAEWAVFYVGLFPS